MDQSEGTTQVTDLMGYFLSSKFSTQYKKNDYILISVKLNTAPTSHRLHKKTSNKTRNFPKEVDKIIWNLNPHLYYKIPSFQRLYKSENDESTELRQIPRANQCDLSEIKNTKFGNVIKIAKYQYLQKLLSKRKALKTSNWP